MSIFHLTLFISTRYSFFSLENSLYYSVNVQVLVVHLRHCASCPDIPQFAATYIATSVTWEGKVSSTATLFPSGIDCLPEALSISCPMREF